MGAIPYPTPISLKDARKHFAREQTKYLNLIQVDKWLDFEITDKQLHDSIKEITL